ncbi:MAG: alcohol dehydrogenase catalytic domain-containing protein, partial [Actinomycetota bacterium]
MRAVRIHEDLSLRVDDVDDPRPGPGEVLVRIHAAGVCGTDLHILDGMIKPDPYPMTLGHEAAGVVEAAGEGVGLAPGTAVAIYNKI